MSNYAESHSDLALLAVNTLQKDSSDQDPAIRGLALRTMCSLRLASLVEYMQRPLMKGLEDRSGYVRKTAVMGCLKLFHLTPGIIQELNLVDRLYAMLRDSDPQVVCNCLIVLDEILADEGGVVLTKTLAHYLFGRLKEFGEWSQCLVMRVLARYEASDEEETYDILNVLDDRLKHVNNGVVLGAIRLFLDLTNNLFDLQEDIYERIKAPLLTLIGLGNSSPEVVFTGLHHVQLLLIRQPRLMDSEFRSFFCRYSDPFYVKSLKLDLLVTISSPSNVVDIVEELSAYAMDVNIEMARRSIRAVGKIAMLHSSCADHCRMKLLALLSLEVSYVSSEVLIVMKDLVRKYVDAADDIVQHLPASAALVTDAEGKAALIWTLGEYGERLPDAPYLLEEYVGDVTDEVSAVVRLQLLTATMKLFFKRPPECQNMLGRLLQYCIDEDVDMDVHDRAVFYYRLLKCNASEAKRVVAGPKPAINLFTEDRLVGVKDKLLSEFNTLAVVYGQPSTNFIPPEPPYTLGSPREGQTLAAATAAAADDRFERTFTESTASASGSSVDGGDRDQRKVGGDTSSIPIGVKSVVGDLVSLDEFLAPEETPPVIVLNSSPKITPTEFERRWLALPQSESVELCLSVVPTPEELEQTMLEFRIVAMASSPAGQPVMKFFFYSQQADTETFFFIEATVDARKSIMTAVFKCEDAAALGAFKEHFRKSLVGKWMPLDF
ncbi:uncharacterized protein [Oscarella lobularis]